MGLFVIFFIDVFAFIKIICFESYTIENVQYLVVFPVRFPINEFCFSYTEANWEDCKLEN